MSGIFDFDLFISYSQRKSCDDVYAFYNSLSNTYKAWIDIKDMKNGFVHEVMSDGVHNSEIFICCLTDEYAKTENCMKELRLAGGLEKTILFVLFEEIKECSQSEVLKKFGLIDTYTNDQSYYYYKDIDNISNSIELILTHKRKLAQSMYQFRNSTSSLSSATSPVDYHNDDDEDDDDDYGS